MKYDAYIQQFESLFIKARSNARVDSTAPSIPALESAPIKNILIVAPHPDDECLMGSYALRLKAEQGARVHVVPYSLGSNPDRQVERSQELDAACKKLGFERIGGVASAPEQLVSILKRIRADMIFSPHADDGHATHIKTYHAVESAIQSYGKPIAWVQTEFWKNMSEPNLIVPLSSAHVTLIGEALMEHQGEIKRNPYHLQLPAWYVDQVRRGSEIVNGAGSKGADFIFGQLYKVIQL